MRRAIPWIFWLSGIYDGVLGLLFLVIPATVFEWYKGAPPNHFAYVQFPGALAVIFALMFFEVARDPMRHRDLVGYGALYKLAFSGVAIGYWLTRGLPDPWKPLAIIDLISLVLFAWAYLSLGQPERAAPAGRQATA